jgi:hypothetical protein
MLYWALVFLVIALLAGLFGFAGIYIPNRGAGPLCRLNCHVAPAYRAEAKK